MKTTIALFSIALLAACASSSSDFIDNETKECEHPVEVRVGFEGLPGVRQERTDDRLTLIVEVANNGNEDFIVKSIRTEQVADEMVSYRLDNGWGTFNQLVPEGKDHAFRLQMSGRGIQQDRLNRRDGSSPDLALAVTVHLQDGDSYRCVFGVRPPL